MQVGAPAYGLLLDEWGDDFLAHGTLEWTFVDMVLEGEVAAASVDLTEPGSATVTVVTEPRARTALVGTAHRRAAPSP